MDTLSIGETALRGPIGPTTRPRSVTGGGRPPVDGEDPTDLGGAALHLRKTRPLVEAISAIVDEVQPRRILELGICQGGSVALLKTLAKSERHVAIELASGAPMLDEWLLAHDPGGVVRTYYGVDQADVATLHEIVRRDFEGRPLDLVIDDASHRYAETRASFNALFPYLREGGLYVVEDWSWVHLLESAILADPGLAARTASTKADGPSAGQLASPSPARLLVEHLITCAGPLGVIDELRVDRYLAIVKRGDADLDPNTFDIGSCFGDVGKALTQEPSR